LYIYIKYLYYIYLISSNILLKNDKIKLADLGVAKNIEHSIVATYTGSPIYISPEMLNLQRDNKVNVKLNTDVWSIGIVIYELIKLKRPFKEINEVLNNSVPDLDSNVPDEFKNIVKE
jgi:NIMA (never in mitosis gene a)-related kinase 1/4/5